MLTPSDEQVEAVLLSAKRSRRDLGLLTLMVDTGARKGEIAALKCEDVDIASGMIRFPVSKSMARTVPLSERSIAALGRWMRERGGGPGSLWGVQNAYALVRRVVDRHSNGQLTPHSLRRSLAVRALRRGVTPTSLIRLCGWSSHRMLAVYSQAHADTIAAEEYLAKMA
jgi:integrase